MAKKRAEAKAIKEGIDKPKFDMKSAIYARKDTNKDPLCLFVTGLESSGNRYLTQILCEMGLEGCSEHEQPFLDNIPTIEEHPRIVIRMSLPHGHQWNHVEVLDKIEKAGYPIYVLNVVRDYYPCLQSSLIINHIEKEEEKHEQIHKSYEILSQIKQEIYPVTYQGLSKPYLYQWLQNRFMLPFPVVTPFKDGDSKW